MMTPDEATAYARVHDLVRTHVANQKELAKEWDKFEAWYRSEYWATPEPRSTAFGQPQDLVPSSVSLNIATNYPYAFIDTMIANVCPTNPQVSVRAKEPDHVEEAKSQQSLINNFLREGKAASKMWRAASNAAVTGRGVLKMVWDEKRKRPKLVVIPSKRFFFDPAATEWEDISYCGELVLLTEEEFAARIDQGLYSAVENQEVHGTQYPNWIIDAYRDDKNEKTQAIDQFKWILVIEFYDFVQNKTYHFLEGRSKPLFAASLPYRYMPNPYCLLVFNDNLRDVGGLSDIKLIAALQERLNEIDTLELVHAFATIPVLLIDSKRCQNVDAVESALKGALTPGSVARVDLNAEGGSLKDIFHTTPVPSLSPSFATMRNRTVSAIEFTLGIPQYSRGVVGNAEVATEAALADGSLRTRNGRRVSAVEQVVSWIARAVICLYQEFMTLSDAVYTRNEREATGKITRTAMGLGLPPNRSEEDEAVLGPSVDLPSIDELLYWYDMAPYSPAENTRLVQLATLQAQWGQLVNNPNVDQKALIQRFLELLLMDDLYVEAPEPVVPPMGEGAPGEPPAGSATGLDPAALASLSQTGTTNTAAGELPPGMEPPQVPLPTGGPGSPISPRVAGALNGKTGIPGTGA